MYRYHLPGLGVILAPLLLLLLPLVPPPGVRLMLTSLTTLPLTHLIKELLIGMHSYSFQFQFYILDLVPVSAKM